MHESVTKINRLKVEIYFSGMCLSNGFVFCVIDMTRRFLYSVKRDLFNDEHFAFEFEHINPILFMRIHFGTLLHNSKLYQIEIFVRIKAF